MCVCVCVCACVCVCVEYLHGLLVQVHAKLVWSLFQNVAFLFHAICLILSVRLCQIKTNPPIGTSFTESSSLFGIRLTIFFINFGRDVLFKAKTSRYDTNGSSRLKRSKEKKVVFKSATNLETLF